VASTRRLKRAAAADGNGGAQRPSTERRRGFLDVERAGGSTADDTERCATSETAKRLYRVVIDGDDGGDASSALTRSGSTSGEMRRLYYGLAPSRSAPFGTPRSPHPPQRRRQRGAAGSRAMLTWTLRPAVGTAPTRSGAGNRYCPSRASKACNDPRAPAPSSSFRKIGKHDDAAQTSTTVLDRGSTARAASSPRRPRSTNSVILESAFPRPRGARRRSSTNSRRAPHDPIARPPTGSNITLADIVADAMCVPGRVHCRWPPWRRTAQRGAVRRLPSDGTKSGTFLPPTVATARCAQAALPASRPGLVASSITRRRSRRAS